MGRSKISLPFEDDTLLARVVERVRSVVPDLILSAGPGVELPPLSVEHVRVDDPVAGQGPLLGLAESLKRAQMLGWSAALVVGGDMPLVRPELLRRLLDLLRDPDDAVIPVYQGLRQPLVAVYRPALHSVATEMLNAGARSMQRLLDRAQVRLVGPEEYALCDPDGHSFLNANTPEEYERLLQLARESR